MGVFFYKVDLAYKMVFFALYRLYKNTHYLGQKKNPLFRTNRLCKNTHYLGQKKNHYLGPPCIYVYVFIYYIFFMYFLNTYIFFLYQYKHKKQPRSPSAQLSTQAQPPAQALCPTPYHSYPAQPRSQVPKPSPGVWEGA